MFRHSVINLTLTLYSALLCAVLRIPGWRWPLTHRITQGMPFDHTGLCLEPMLFSTLKYTAQLRFLRYIKSPLVLIATLPNDTTLMITFYRLIADEGQQDMSIPTNASPGRGGVFYYLYNRGLLHHALRPTSVTRKMGFIESEPVFSLRLPISDRQKTVIHGDVVLQQYDDGNVQHTRITYPDGAWNDYETKEAN